MANTILTRCPYCGKLHSVNPGQTFESVAVAPQVNQEARQSGFWATDGPTYALAGLAAFCGAYAICLYYGWPAVPAVISGLGVGTGLHVLKLFLYAPPKPKAAPAGDVEHISVTVHTPLPNSNRVQLDETFSVKAAALRHVAKVVIGNGHSFSRRMCHKKGVCSQEEFAQIQATMLARHWAEADPDHPQGGVKLNRHGVAVLRAVHRGTMSGSD